MDSICTNIFKTPIQYVKHNNVPEHILNDLELCGENNMIQNIYKSKNNFLYDKLTKYYTTDVKYLKEFQSFVKKYKTLPLIENNFRTQWTEFINETSFKQKYSYVEWDHLDFCNKSSALMQIISVCNLMSPVVSLLIPILFLIFPFILLRFIHKVPITFASYKNTLFENMKNNIIGQFIQEFSRGGNYDKKMYVLMGIGFYMFTVYQNFLACLKFYNNVSRVKKMLYLTKNHISHYINIHDAVASNLVPFSKLKDFKQDAETHAQTLKRLYSELEFIQSESFSIKDVNSIGDLLSLLYRLYDSTEYNKSLQYSFDYLEYIGFIQQLQKHTNRTLQWCAYTNNPKKTKLTKQYYLALLNKSHVKNTVTLNKNYIITGPNASGKTTLLKTTLINVLLCQQIGAGCFSRARICPYNNMFCYLNIPDTSNRDSLFQAEARRCLEIMTSIEENKGNNICIFDELYSGTNPEEAVKSAYAYLKYMSKLPVTFLLTTHYYKLCDLESEYENVKNIHMNSTYKNGALEYEYTIKNGISSVKGGCEVLKQLNYPKEILRQI